jgi:hypothetical protein
MNMFDSNPFAMLTLIVAPAVLTNASTVMNMSTSNRLARAIDRARLLAKLVAGREGDPEVASLVRQLRSARSRVFHLMRALTSFYLSVGAFAAASLISLVGAAIVYTHQDWLRPLVLGAAFVSGVIGVGGLLFGSTVLVFETRHAVRSLIEEEGFLALDLGAPPRPSA